MNLRRLGGFSRKEWRQMLRDPSSIVVAFVLPAALLFLFGFGVSLDLRDVPVAVVVEQPTPESTGFFHAMAASKYVTPIAVADRRMAEEALRNRQVLGIIVIGDDFSRRILSGQATPAQLIVDGTDANSARLVEGYVQGVWNTWIAQFASERLGSGAVRDAAPVDLRARVWFNPAVNSRHFLVPGLIAIIMTLIGALLTALVVAREWERGTMEALLTTRLTRGEFLMGKTAPYFLLGMGGMAAAVMLSVTIFGVPFRGSVWVLVLCSAAFMLVMLGIGLLISTVTRNQFVASIAALLVTMLPATMLSGFLFDIASMPGWVQVITHVVAARYFVAILQTLFLAGDIWAVIGPNLLALCAMASLFVGLTVWRTRRRLE